MSTHEYKIINLVGTLAAREAQLNKLGAEGFLVVGFWEDTVILVKSNYWDYSIGTNTQTFTFTSAPAPETFAGVGGSDADRVSFNWTNLLEKVDRDAEQEPSEDEPTQEELNA